MQCERRNQVEPRCAERWHLRDDEQFDLAAWFLFTLETELVTCGQLLLYLDIAFAVKDTDYFAQNEEKGEKVWIWLRYSNDIPTTELGYYMFSDE